MKRRSRIRKSIVISAVLLVFTAVLLAAARFIPGFAPLYSRTVYAALVGSLGRLTGILPFSAGEMLCALVPAAIALFIVLIIILRKRLGHPLRLIFTTILLISSVLSFMYAANCGVNYYRTPFVDRTAFDQSVFTEDQLAEFCEYAVSQVSSTYDPSYFAEYPSDKALADRAADAMRNLSAYDIKFCDFSSLSGFYPRPKQLTFLSGLFSSMGVSGIYSPFTIEANINGEMPGLEKPFTACHELSHLKGFMNEGEANYIGWLACICSGDPAFERSGWLIAWIYAGNSLYACDQERYSDIRKKLPAEAVRELDENSEFWSSRKTAASDVQDRLNDAYLKSNGQENGIRTYGQLTTMMLMWYYEGR